jgi:hypothetical protein
VERQKNMVKKFNSLMESRRWELVELPRGRMEISFK